MTKTLSIKVLLGLFLMLSVQASTLPTKIIDLKCENEVTPVGVTNAKPSFSWTYVGNEDRPTQGGYRICMASSLEKLRTAELWSVFPNLWDTGPTSSSQNSGLKYYGEPLKSGQRVYWQVYVWSENRGLTVSEPSWFEMGEIESPEKSFEPHVFQKEKGVTHITIDGKGQGRVFEGIGAVSAGASTDLLYDYEDPIRSQILDLLFKPKFGAGFQHLKVEMGGGENSTCGSEPSHAITKEEIQNPVSRGYEFWFMKEAKNRNPDMILEYLPWSFPGWLKPNIFTQDSADYFVAFLEVAREQWNLEIDWVAAAENENGTDRDWLVNHVRPTLDAKGFEHVKIQGPDDNSGDWRIFEDFEGDPELEEIVEAVGYHYVTGREFNENMVDGRGRPTTAKAKQSGKPLWASEDWSWTGAEWGGAGALNLARLYNKFYIRDEITKSLIWAPIGSIYKTVVWDKAGAMKANRPWSGYYEVWPTIWATAHTTQFAEPDSWKYLDGACGLFDKDTYKGSCVTLREKDGKNWSMIICTEKEESIVVNVDADLENDEVHVWKSSEQEQFVQLDSVKIVDGELKLKLDAKCIYSVTTTTGQQKGEYEIPEDASFPFPYVEDYEGRKVGDLPKYHSDQKGSFEIALRPDGKGQCMKQIVPEEGYEWMRIYRQSFIKPNTLIGDVDWKNYSCSVDVFIEDGDVELGGRIKGVFLKGYRLKLSEGGSWEIIGPEKTTLAKGKIGGFDGSSWHNLKLAFQDAKIQAFIDDKLVRSIDAEEGSGNGYVSLASSYDNNCFDNLKVEPVDR